MLNKLQTIVESQWPDCRVLDIRLLSGGDINQSFYLALEGTEQTELFIKANHRQHRTMLDCEYQSLQFFSQCSSPDYSLNYPQPYFIAEDSELVYLAMQYFQLQPLHQNMQQAGELLARQHKITAEQFGWTEDNYIGYSKQPNQENTDWLAFFSEQRLQYQLQLAQPNNLNPILQQGIQTVIDNVEQYFVDYQPAISLVHGDLWSGNIAFASLEQKIVLYDPAPYFADREVDLAMTELFGGFDSGFYAAYNAAYPLHKGYAERKNLYNLYHALNHFNLFGAGYESMLNRLLNHLT